MKSEEIKIKIGKLNSKIQKNKERLALQLLVENSTFIDLKNNIVNDVRAYYIESSDPNFREYRVLFKINNKLFDNTVKVNAEDIFKSEMKEIISREIFKIILTEFNFM